MRTFLYFHCDDLGLARSFYSTVLGLTETFFSDEEGVVGYQVGGLQITVASHPASGRTEGWASQLGWRGGSTSAPSWGIEFPSDGFRQAVKRAITSGVEAFHPEPEWVGYWSFPVKDPMGNTVELSTPEQVAWALE